MVDIIAVNNLEKASTKSSMASVRFLLVNATKHGVDNVTLDRELQQLGLPKEHSAAICKTHSEFSERIREHLEANRLQINQFDSISVKHLPNLAKQITVGIKDEIVDGIPRPTEHVLTMSRSDLLLCFKELETIKSIMEEYDSSK